MRYSIIILFTFISIASCKDKELSVQEINARQVNINDSLSTSKAIDSFIKPYKNHVDKEMDSVLAVAPRSLSKSDSPYNTALGNMLADAVMEYANPVFKNRTTFTIDAVLLNYGGMRATLPEGNITMRDAYKIMPFENRVMVLELSGKKVNKMFEYLKEGTAHPFSGLHLVINENGNIDEALIHDKPVDETETYFIATTDYLQNGGDHMDFFQNPISILDLDYKLRAILIDYFIDQDTIAPVQDDRFIKI